MKSNLSLLFELFRPAAGDGSAGAASLWNDLTLRVMIWLCRDFSLALHELNRASMPEAQFIVETVG